MSTAALELIRRLVREWQCVDGTSACDLLDEIADDARTIGLVTPEDIAKWDAEELEEGDD